MCIHPRIPQNLIDDPLTSTRSPREIYDILDGTYLFDRIGSIPEIDEESGEVISVRTIHGTIIYHTRRSYRTDRETRERELVNWSTFPSGAWNPYPRRRLQVLQTIIRNIKCPHFYLGGCHRSFPSSTWFAIEFDAQGVMLDESNYGDYINHCVLGIFEEQGMRPHIMLSGNRSVHLVWFFDDLVDNEVLTRLEIAARNIATDPTIVDCNSLTQGMRFPGFYHRETGNLSRFIGCQTKDDNLDYLQSIVRFPPIRLEESLYRIEGRLSDLTPPTPEPDPSFLDMRGTLFGDDDSCRGSGSSGNGSEDAETSRE